MERQLQGAYFKQQKLSFVVLLTHHDVGKEEAQLGDETYNNQPNRHDEEEGGYSLDRYLSAWVNLVW